MGTIIEFKNKPIRLDNSEEYLKEVTEDIKENIFHSVTFEEIWLTPEGKVEEFFTKEEIPNGSTNIGDLLECYRFDPQLIEPELMEPLSKIYDDLMTELNKFRVVKLDLQSNGKIYATISGGTMWELKNGPMGEYFISYCYYPDLGGTIGVEYYYNLCKKYLEK